MKKHHTLITGVELQENEEYNTTRDQHEKI
jgi:hypothetical protein